MLCCFLTFKDLLVFPILTTRLFGSANVGGYFQIKQKNFFILFLTQFLSD